jgi:hypothetical protein
MNNFQIGYYLRVQADETEALTTAHGFIIETFNKKKTSFNNISSLTTTTRGVTNMLV